MYRLLFIDSSLVLISRRRRELAPLFATCRLSSFTELTQIASDALLDCCYEVALLLALLHRARLRKEEAPAGGLHAQTPRTHRGASGDEAGPLRRHPAAEERGRRANEGAGAAMEPTTTTKKTSAEAAVSARAGAASRCLKWPGARTVGKSPSASSAAARRCARTDGCVTGARTAEAGMCEHRRQRALCKECGGRGICGHGRQRNKCVECGGSGICEHGGNGSTAGSAAGLHSASTVVRKTNARRAK